VLLSLSVNNKTSDAGSGKLFTTITDGGSSSQLPGHTGFGGLNVDFYNLFTSFVNQTRMTVPDIVHHGNYSLIQLGLLCAIGAMAAGAATIVGEAIVFRQHETDLEQYKLLKEQHAHHPPSASYGAPSSSYGAPSHSYGAVSDSYGLPHDSHASSSYINSYSVPYQSSKFKLRKKRDSGQSGAPFSYPQIVKSYGNSNKLPQSNLQSFYGSLGTFPFGDTLQGASSSINSQNNPFKQKFYGQEASGLQNQNYPSSLQLGTSKRQRLRPRDPSLDYEQSFRILPLLDNPYEFSLSEKRKEKRRKKYDPLKSEIDNARRYNRRDG